MANAGHKLLGIVLSAVKAFFNAVVSLCWGMAVFFLMSALFNYYKIDTSAITTLLKLVVFIQEKWLWFFWALFIWDFIVNLKDFLRPIYQEQQVVKGKETKL